VRRRQETERLQKIVAATQQALAAREGLITVHEKLCEEQKRQLESAGRLAEEKSSLAEKHIALSTQQAWPPTPTKPLSALNTPILFLLADATLSFYRPINCRKFRMPPTNCYRRRRSVRPRRRSVPR
jgi:hypothetical protein